MGEGAYSKGEVPTREDGVIAAPVRQAPVRGVESQQVHGEHSLKSPT
jgi:hypothetical protein